MAAQGQPDFSLPELIDLALCSPEVGAVNFNILRIFLHELLRKFGYGEEPAQLNDVQAHQIQNFKNYIQGSASASPMPGVLRYSTGHQFAAQTPRSAKSTSRLSAIAIPKQDAPPAPGPSGQPPTSPKGFVGDTNKNVASGPKGTQLGSHAHPLTGRDTGGSSAPKGDLESKVARLERHLEALYALPTNQQILGDKESAPQGMSVNDMWQIIQLNNRVAAAEAAIQKMASLIEDLAREMKSVKADAFNSRKESLKVDPMAEQCAEKCDKAQNAVDNLRRELENIKNHLQQELNRLQNATGVDPAKVPSFMKIPPTNQPPQVAQVAPVVRNPNQTQGQKPAAQGQSQGQSQSQKGQGQTGAPLRTTQSHTGITSQPNSTRTETNTNQQQGQPGQTVTQTTTTKQPGVPGASAQQTVTNAGQGGQQGGQAGNQGQTGQGNQGGNQGQNAQGGQPAGLPPKLQPHPAPASQGQQSPKGQGQGQGQQGKPSGGQHGGQMSSQQGQHGPQHSQGQNQNQGHSQGQNQNQGHSQGQNQNQGHPQGQNQNQGHSQGQNQNQGQGQGQAAGHPGQSGQNQPTSSTAGNQPTGANAQQGPSNTGGGSGQKPTSSKTQPGTGDGGKTDAQAGSDHHEHGHIDRQHLPSPADKHPPGSGGSQSGSQQHSHHHGHRHPEAGATAAHPETRHHFDHIPVDVTNKPLTGVIHQDHAKPFHDYKGTCYAADPDPGRKPIVPVENDQAGFIPPFAPTTDTDKPYQVDPCAGQTELVQKELQLQYAKLQGMQRQMAMEIQDKMEFVYQKLLREIENQHLTTSPYMTVGSAAEKCLGPGVCAGHGMPADTAVCQFPQATVEKFAVPPAGQGHGVPCQIGPESATATAPGVCPGANVCPACKNDILHHLRGSPQDGKMPDYGFDPRVERQPGYSASTENLLRQGNNSMILLPRDLEELRDKVKAQGQIPDVFDEIDVLEKLATLWEAVNVLKLNEESIAIRLVKQDAVLKNVPTTDSKEKNVDAASKAKPKTKVSASALENTDLNVEDIQTIFTNLSNLVIEHAALKEKQEKFNDSLRDFEDMMVTKPMLVDAMSDKADKGQMNTKVSYDEFGASMEELTNKLQTLMLEVYQKNENWKQLTDKMMDELSEKLDKAEIGPLRAYFKNHLGAMQEQVAHLTKLIDEPDPAGTRKKLLKDYNCISCDRHTAISGVTNCPTLPMLGPVLAGHTTASVRAFELRRLRDNCRKYDPEGRDFNLMEKQNKNAWPGRSAASSCASARQGSINDADVMNLVNRYVGGSHTAITNTDRIAALNKRPSTGKNYPTHTNPNPTANEEVEGEQGLDLEPPPPTPTQARPQTVATPYQFDQYTYEEE